MPHFYSIIRKPRHIDDLLNRCAEAVNTGTSQYRGKSYEAGVQAGIEWMCGVGVTNEHPLGDAPDADERAITEAFS